MFIKKYKIQLFYTKLKVSFSLDSAPHKKQRPSHQQQCWQFHPICSSSCVIVTTRDLQIRRLNATLAIVAIVIPADKLVRAQRLQAQPFFERCEVLTQRCAIQPTLTERLFKHLLPRL